jgi:hypothetical protein
MLRRMALVAGGVLTATLALAAVGDIPTRYSGSFPSDGLRTNISGTFTGKSLRLSFTAHPKNSPPLRRTFAGNCTVSPPNQTSCNGRIQGSGSDTFNVPAVAVVTWSAGRPAALSISK